MPDQQSLPLARKDCLRRDRAIVKGALRVVALMTRAPPGPFTPEPFGAARAVLRKCGVAVS
jgi:hypothetical protein